MGSLEKEIQTANSKTTAEIVKNYSVLLTWLNSLENTIKDYKSKVAEKLAKFKNKSKEDILKINGFDNEFVGWGREDSEFLARFLNSGGVRYDLKFNAIAYHIFHEENERRYLKKNEDRLKKTVNKKIKVCENGINKFLGE